MITFELVTLQGLTFGEEVYEVVLPTPDGSIAIFPNHMPLISLATPGMVAIRRRESDKDEAMERFAVNGGVIEIDGRRVRLLADEADHESELVEAEITTALKRAKEEASKAEDRLSYEKANQLIQVQQARLKVASMKRRRKNN